MIKLSVAMLVLCISAHAIAQNAGDEDSIKATINTFFLGMEANDTPKIRSTVEPSRFLKTIARNQKGETIL
ncbi:MAG: hypothetical protein ABI594_11730 [Ginsengibacter sp.]